MVVMLCELCHDDIAEYDCWFKVKCPLTEQNMINQRYNVCKSCAKQSIAYEEHGEKVFENKEEWCYQI